MDRELDRTHIDPPREPEIGIEEVAVPVLFRRPPPQPTCPGVGTDAGGVLGDLFERDGIIGQGFLGDHVAHQDNEHLVGQLLRGGAELPELLRPILGGQIGEEVGRLPGLINRCQQGKILLDDSLQALDQVHLGSLLEPYPGCPGSESGFVVHRETHCPLVHVEELDCSEATGEDRWEDAVYALLRSP